MELLNLEDLEVIEESLKYTIFKFQDYSEYPSEEYRQKRINDVRSVSIKIAELIKQLK
jgi:hypothetical protein